MDNAPTEMESLDDSFRLSFDGQVWAKAFLERAKLDPKFATDEGNLIGWFANAIMRGFDDISQGRPPDQVAFLFSKLTNEDRANIMMYYCPCGGARPCNCWS